MGPTCDLVFLKETLVANCESHHPGGIEKVVCAVDTIRMRQWCGF